MTWWFDASTYWYLIFYDVPRIVGWTCRLNLPATHKSPNLHNFLSWCSPLFRNIGRFNGLREGLTHVCNFLWWSSYFSPAKPLSPAASGRGSSVATGIPWAAYIQCRTWLILYALQKLASCQAGYAIIRKLNIFVPVKLEIKLQYIDNSHITECFRRKAGLVWHWALHPLAECWSAMKCKRFREFCAFCFGQTVKSGQIQRLFGLRRHIAQP